MQNGKWAMKQQMNNCFAWLYVQKCPKMLFYWVIGQNIILTSANQANLQALVVSECEAPIDF